MYCEWTLENDTVNKPLTNAPKGLYQQKRLIENLITPTDAPKRNIPTDAPHRECHNFGSRA